MSGAEEIGELTVVIEPPCGSRWKHEKARALCVQLAEMYHGLNARRRVMSGIRSPFIARKVPGSISVDTNQSFVAFAHDEHHRAWRHDGANALANVVDQRSIFVLMHA